MYRAIESQAVGSKYPDGKGALRAGPDHSTVLRRFSDEREIIQTFAKGFSALARERRTVAFHIDTHPLRYRFALPRRNYSGSNCIHRFAALARCVEILDANITRRFLSMDKGFRDTANMQELFQPVGEQQNSQQMKAAWQDHIKAAASAYEDAKNCSNTQIGGRLLDFLR